MRDLDKNPYSPDEQRVAHFFFERGIGGGDDPIGSLIASHQYLIMERRALREALEEIIKEVGTSTKDSKIATAVLASPLPSTEDRS